MPETMVELPTKAAAGKRIMVVEDNAVNQKVMVRMLTSVGADVEMANHGQEAVDKFVSLGGNLDMILMDCQMPIMDGFTATKEIRRLEGELAGPSRGMKRVPIVALTASATTDYEDLCREAGMNLFLTKPLKKESLIRVLGAVFSKTQE